MDSPVNIKSVKLSELLSGGLNIPEYQRGYCWRIRNIRDLLDDIIKWQRQHDTDYHLGIVILREVAESSFDVIDGQQRLTTMAIWQYLTDKTSPPPILQSRLKINNLTSTVQQAILRARDTVKSYQEQKVDIDFAKITVSAVIIDKNQPLDLSYTFFSNSNSTGKRLSDYDLLKAHHLRYIQQDKTARKMFDFWHSLEKSGRQDELLHQRLFRLRNWRNKIPFVLDASESQERDVFRHYSESPEPLDGFPYSLDRQFRFDSILPGGYEFFRYVEHYREKYESFCALEVVKKLDNRLEPHNSGILHAGIKSLAFLFYCKFGTLYLNEAIYVLAYHLSRLRNESQIRGAYLAGNPFQDCTVSLDRVISESEFFAIILAPVNHYTITNKGSAAVNYWNDLKELLRELRYSPQFSIPEEYLLPIEQFCATNEAIR